MDKLTQIGWVIKRWRRLFLCMAAFFFLCAVLVSFLHTNRWVYQQTIQLAHVVHPPHLQPDLLQSSHDVQLMMQRVVLPEQVALWNRHHQHPFLALSDISLDAYSSFLRVSITGTAKYAKQYELFITQLVKALQAKQLDDVAIYKQQLTSSIQQLSRQQLTYQRDMMMLEKSISATSHSSSKAMNIQRAEDKLYHHSSTTSASTLEADSHALTGLMRQVEVQSLLDDLNRQKEEKQSLLDAVVTSHLDGNFSKAPGIVGVNSYQWFWIVFSLGLISMIFCALLIASKQNQIAHGSVNTIY